MSDRSVVSRARHLLALTVLVGYAAIVSLMTLSPTPIDRGYGPSITQFLDTLHRNGVPGWFGYDSLEFTANVVMFLPLGFLIGLAVPRRLSWAALVIVPAISIAIEVSQAVFLAARTASVTDVMANTVGGVIGVAVAVAFGAMMTGRRPKVIARTSGEHENGRRTPVEA